jgi:chemotaxis protein CheC
MTVPTCPESSMRSEEVTLTADDLHEYEIMLEIGSMGAGHASTALSNLLREPIRIDVPRYHTAPPHLVPRIYQRHEATVAAVFMQLRSEIECDFMLVFEAAEATKIADLMASSTKINPVDCAMEESALTELGSIMICSFLNAIANFTATELVPSPPQLIIDNFDAIIDGLLIKQALCSNLATIFDARFKRLNSAAEGFLIMFPSHALQTLLTNKGKTWL